MMVQKYVGGDTRGEWSVWFKQSMITGPVVEVVHEASWTTYVYDPEDPEWWKNPGRNQKNPPARIRDKAERAWKRGTGSLSGKPDLRITG